MRDKEIIERIVAILVGSRFDEMRHTEHSIAELLIEAKLAGWDSEVFSYLKSPSPKPFYRNDRHGA